MAKIPSEQFLRRTAKVVRKVERGLPARHPIGRARFNDSDPIFQRMKVGEIHDDWLACIRLASDGSAIDPTHLIRVAKPYLLRKNPFAQYGRHLETYVYLGDEAQNRTATIGAESANQAVKPRYMIGDNIYAVRMFRGGSGVEVVFNQGQQNEYTQEMVWIDANLDARAWCVID